MAKKSRNTRQRAVILDFLRQSCSHPTAEAVYHEARKHLPNISLGTVYRNLNFLRDQGLAREIRPLNGSSMRFDGNLHPHAHFHCSDCREVCDLPLPASLSAQDWSNENVHSVDSVDLHLIGSCTGCRTGDSPKS